MWVKSTARRSFEPDPEDRIVLSLGIECHAGSEG
jgi:hypothetical protein